MTDRTKTCLLYTSDAADGLQGITLGDGRKIKTNAKVEVTW